MSRKTLSIANVRAAMRKAGGRVPVAAKALGVSASHLWTCLRWVSGMAKIKRAPRGRPSEDRRAPIYRPD
jgi:hypothetical protein